MVQLIKLEADVLDGELQQVPETSQVLGRGPWVGIHILTNRGMKMNIEWMEKQKIQTILQFSEVYHDFSVLSHWNLFNKTSQKPSCLTQHSVQLSCYRNQELPEGTLP